jgi:hypothetical protein
MFWELPECKARSNSVSEGKILFAPNIIKMAVAAVKNLKSGNFCSSPLPVFISAFIPV